MPDDATITRPVPPASSPPARRRRVRLLAGVAAVALVLGAAACSDDDPDDEAGSGSSTTTTEPSDAGSSSEPADSTTTVDNSQGKPLNETDELIAALAAPGDIAERLEVKPESVGDGSFHPELCPDNEVEVTWDDQASQGLLRTGEGGTLIVTQSVLAFPDDGTADAFLDDYLEGVEACNPAVQVEDTTDIGDRLVRVTASTGDEPASAAGAFVRQGAHVVYLQATGDPAADLAGVVSDDLLTRLVGLLPA